MRKFDAATKQKDFFTDKYEFTNKKCTELAESELKKSKLLFDIQAKSGLQGKVISTL